MVLENIFKIEFLEKRPYISFFLGFIYTLIGFGVALIFFGKNISIAMLFLTTLLLVPSMIKLIGIEEKRESIDGLKKFFTDHKDIFEIYIFAFLGIFVGYLFLGLIFSKNPSLYAQLFDFQVNFLEHQQGLSAGAINAFLSSSINVSFSNALSLIANNMGVAVISFLLSFFYGASAIFLLILNASVFSNFITFVVNYLSEKLSHTIAILGMFCIHLIPEVSGFLLAAISGGVLSKALLREKRGSKEFKNVLKDAVVLLLLSFALIFIAALLETYVTAGLFHRFF
jgi:uncharacterized membrane protein SpoIIM required for sporulation